MLKMVIQSGSLYFIITDQLGILFLRLLFCIPSKLKEKNSRNNRDFNLYSNVSFLLLFSISNYIKSSLDDTKLNKNSFISYYCVADSQSETTFLVNFISTINQREAGLDL